MAARVSRIDRGMKAYPLSYQVRIKQPHAHLFEVQCRIDEPDPAGVVLTMPAWTPGSYLIRDFARHVVNIHAADDRGEIVALTKLDKHNWRAAPCRQPLTVTLEIYAWDNSVRGAHLDATHAFFNGTSLFPRIVGYEHQQIGLRILPPPSLIEEKWHVATAMTAVDVDEAGFGWYETADYEELIDHPVEMGVLTTIAFEAAGVPHTLVIRGRHQADQERLARDLGRLCTHQIEFFGKPAPMSRYLFLLHAAGEGYGGLEHRASSALIISRDALPRVHEMADYPDEDYREYLGLCSHEYFHTWNVKRIRPAAFIGADLGREAYTRLLWAFEGITSYYDELFLLRCGLIRAEDYLTMLARGITRVYRTPGRHRQSLAESSFDAWIKFYKPDENAPNALVSYYAKGALVALALDLSLRRATAQRVSLDTVMRELWRRHGQTGAGVPEDGIERLASELSGLDLRDFFARYVEGVEDPPLAELLAQVGIHLSWTAARNAQDLGGYSDANSTEVARGCTLGIKINGGEGGARVVQVYTDGCAQQAGIAAGDILIAWDGLRLDGERLNRALRRAQPGQEIILHGFRGDQLMQFTVRLQAVPADTCRLSWIAAADAGQLEARACWLQPNLLPTEATPASQRTK